MNDRESYLNFTKIQLPASQPGVAFTPWYLVNNRLFLMKTRIQQTDDLRFQLTGEEEGYDDFYDVKSHFDGLDVFDEIVERPTDSHLEKQTKEQLKIQLLDVIAGIAPINCHLRAQKRVDCWGKEIFELEVLQGQNRIGYFPQGVPRNISKLIINMADNGFVFETNANFELAHHEMTEFGSAASVTTIGGVLPIPELSRLFEFDPTQPGLFDL